jgi:hypothetical protein
MPSMSNPVVNLIIANPPLLRWALYFQSGGLAVSVEPAKKKK